MSRCGGECQDASLLAHVQVLIKAVLLLLLCDSDLAGTAHVVVVHGVAGLLLVRRARLKFLCCVWKSFSDN